MEANYLLRILVGADNFAPGFSAAEQALVNLALQLQQDSPALIPDIKTIESADAVLILGEDVTNTAPRIALALRQSVRNKAYELAAAAETGDLAGCRHSQSGPAAAQPAVYRHGGGHPTGRRG